MKVTTTTAITTTPLTSTTTIMHIVIHRGKVYNFERNLSLTYSYIKRVLARQIPDERKTPFGLDQNYWG